MNDFSCRRCIYLMAQLNSKHPFRRLENNNHVKHEYDDTLFPLQYFLIFICFINNISILMIFQKAFQLFSTSNFLIILCLCIYGELFIKDQPNVYYTIYHWFVYFSFYYFSLIPSI